MALYPTNDMVSRLGPLVVRDFLAPGDRASLRERLAEVEERPSQFATPDGDLVVDRDHRRARLFAMPAEADELVLARLEDMRPTVERHFDDRFDGCRPPQWIGYGEGDFHKPHVDWYDDESWSRRVTAVAFLNGEGAGDDDFEGGTLVLYGLMGEDPPRHGFPVRAEPGMVIFFRAGTTHEVLPVTRGRRWAIASWYVPSV